MEEQTLSESTEDKVSTELDGEIESNYWKYHILIGSKHEEFLEQTQYALRKGDFKITTSSSSKEIFKIIKKEKPHLLILDVEIDDLLDGVEICWDLKSDTKTHSLPILFISEKEEDFIQMAAYEAGADDFIIRPSRSRILLAKLNAWLHRCYEISENSEQVRIFGNIEIDEDQFMVYKKGESLKISKKEFQLLLLLTSKPGKVFRRNNILAKVWGDDIIVGDRNIDTHVKKLRKKLGKDHIHTVRGIGYKFKY
ncbi:MAG TPA: response regulator transcription factor [Chitinophagales bacterium]|nr:response regulator transcription factor [Chitinophagales bacterium]